MIFPQRNTKSRRDPHCLNPHGFTFQSHPLTAISIRPRDNPDLRAAICQPTVTGTIPSSIPPSPAAIPLRTLPPPSDPRREHTGGVPDSTNEKRRLSSESATSEFSRWSDTGDLAEQFADEEDPLQINLRDSFENQTGGTRKSRPQGRHSKQVRHLQHKRLDRKTIKPGVDKEAIEIPSPLPRRISRTEKLLATIMTGNRPASHTHGLVGKPLLYVFRKPSGILCYKDMD